MISVALVLLLRFVAAHSAPTLDVDWESFLSRSDLIWTWGAQQQSTIPTKWYHSAFMGSGGPGIMVRAMDSTPLSGLQVVISSSAIWDDRPPGANYSTGNFVYDRPRLPVGYFQLHFSGTVVNASMRLDLYNAETRGSIVTTQGSVALRAFVMSRYDIADVFVIELNCTGGEAAAYWTWTPEIAASTWANQDPSYVPNPPPQQVVQSGVNVTIQRHLVGTFHASGFVVKPGRGGVGSTILYGAMSGVEMNAARYVVNQILQAVGLGDVSSLLVPHRNWWHSYYPASFLTLSDSKTESFYWIQMYKLASGTRPDRIVYDLMGPWFIDGTDWPDLHWDLNVQLTYMPTFGANRLFLGESLFTLLDNNVQHLMSNVPAEWQFDSAAAPSGASSLECWETCYWDYGPDCKTAPPTITGNLMWVMQLYYLQYQYSMNATLLAQRWLPLMQKATNFYVHMQYFNATDATYNLPTTFSPEYTYCRGNNTNYDLALYRWGLDTMLKVANEILHVPLSNMSAYNASIQHLVQYPIDDNGFMIAKDCPFAVSHRHFSHLFPIWPLRTLNFSSAADVDLSVTSLDHWLGLTGGLTGFCRPVAATMSNILGRRSAAYSNVTYLLDNYILPNTFYHEGENGECGETPPMAASAIQDWMILTYDEKLHVFHGVDDAALTDTAFYNLRAEGGFLVTASRTRGVTAFVSVTLDSTVAAPGGVHVVTDMTQGALAWTPSTAPVETAGLPLGEFKVLLQPGQEVTVYVQGEEPTTAIRPSAGDGDFNAWGLHP